MSEPVPPRVLAAEARREFREQLARGSLDCPCGHLLADHDADDWDRDGEPVNRRCRAAGCECGPVAPTLRFGEWRRGRGGVVSMVSRIGWREFTPCPAEHPMDGAQCEGEAGHPGEHWQTVWVDGQIDSIEPWGGPDEQGPAS